MARPLASSLFESRSRWVLVAVAAAAMGVAGTYQFAWSSIRVPLGARVGAPETALGTAFTLFVALQTISQFPAGWVRDRIGPRPPAAVGGLLLAAGYAGLAWAPGVASASLFYALGGVGAGSVYTVAINTPVKWFDDRRGLATGVVGFAYAGLSFALIPFVQAGLADAFEATMLGLAGLVGAVTLLAVPFLRDPDTGDGADPEREEPAAGDGEPPEPGAGTSPGPGYAWRETVRTWQFWLLYAVFAVVNGVGLMVIGKVVAFAEVMGLPAVTAAVASLVALGDGAGVVVGGSVADRLGYERTMAGTLVLCGGCLAAAALTAADGRPLVFVALITGAAFFRSPAFSVFPSLVGDYYGTGHSSENYAALYSAKLWGGVAGGTVASALVVQLGWTPTFLLGAVLIAAAGAATGLLRPVDPRPA